MLPDGAGVKWQSGDKALSFRGWNCASPETSFCYRIYLAQNGNNQFINIKQEVLVMPGKINDISQLLIDPSLSKDERIKSYLEQMENPYHYIDNGTAVRLRFADTSESLTDRLILAAQAIEM